MSRSRGFSSLVLLGCFAGSCGLFLTGCGETPHAVFDFATPRVQLFILAPGERVGLLLRSDGPEIEVTGDLYDPRVRFVVRGVGTVHLASLLIEIVENGVSIDGEFIESAPKAYRNAVMRKDGTIEKDRFLPFEAWWGYHPRPPWR